MDVVHPFPSVILKRAGQVSLLARLFFLDLSPGFSHLHQPSPFSSRLAGEAPMLPSTRFPALVPLPLLVAVAAVLAAGPALADQKKARPNIVFILADDLGWTDVGCQGSRFYQTPNIDRLASAGTRFTQFYSCPNCAPTRAALM